jgi:N-acetylneuraminate lyase
MVEFRGIWPALVTPLDARGRADVEATGKLIDALLEAEIGGLYVLGGAGEGVLLSRGVRHEMAEVVMASVGGRVPVMVHVGALSTDTSIELTQHANLAGVDAISAALPFHYDYPFQAIQGHFRAITAESQVPVFVHYAPMAAAASIRPEQLLDLCALDGVAGFLHVSRDIHFLSRVMALRDAGKVVAMSGADELLLPSLALGVEGATGITANILPRLVIDIAASFAKGEMDTARRLQFAANRIVAAMLPYGLVPAVKATLTSLGLRVGGAKAPMPVVEGDQARKLRRELDEAGLPELLRRSSLYGKEGDPLRGKLG